MIHTKYQAGIELAAPGSAKSDTIPTALRGLVKEYLKMLIL